MAPYGLGTWASRSLVYSGGAIILACRDVKDKMLKIAAHLMKRNVGDLIYADGAVAVRDLPAEQISMQEIARIAYHQSTLLPDEMDPGLKQRAATERPTQGAFLIVYTLR